MRARTLEVEHVLVPPALLLEHLHLQQHADANATDGFNLLLLLPIIAGALLALALALWLLARCSRKRRRRDTSSKRSESALLPIVDPTELLSPASRQSSQQQQPPPRGAMLSFVAPAASSPVPAPTVEQMLDHMSCDDASDRITAAESTALFRVLHRDPNVTDHRIAFHKLAFERLLSSRARRSSSLATRAPQSGCRTPQRVFETWLGQYDGEAIVVKVLASHASSVADLQQLVHEIQVTASLDHPNVVRFLGIAWDSPAVESLCMVTEYVQQGDLERYVRLDASERSLRWSRMLAIVTGVARALQYLHARRVVHGCVRAKNVVLSRRDWTPKLVNIGTARRYDAADEAALQSRAWLWTAPEVRIGGAASSERSDIYAFGALLLEIDATEPRPCNDDDSEDASGGGAGAAWLDEFTWRVHTIPGAGLAKAFTPACPPRIVEIAQMCLRDAPEDRIDAASLVAVLESIADSVESWTQRLGESSGSSSSVP